jgi:class 3 adenylate cyclase
VLSRARSVLDAIADHRAGLPLTLTTLSTTVTAFGRVALRVNVGYFFGGRDRPEVAGMSEYAERFAEDDIDFDVLGELTDQDFDRLGVSVGHRRRMPRAIREGGGSAPATPPSVAAPPPPSAERRQLTVMFCNLVGSTELSGKLDPEDLRGIIGTYHRCCTDCIERNGGFVAKYRGDGVLAYFGCPRAHEHDTERAVRAGLILVEAVPKLETAIAGTSLQVRVGIATGLVVVGDLIGSGEAQERGIVGETPNLARAFRASPRRTQSSSPKAPEDFSAISLSCGTLGPRSSRASSRRRAPGRH